MADTIPGDSTSITTLEINTSATSAIDYFGDSDWWRVSLSAGFGYWIGLNGFSTFEGTLVDPWLGVTNSSGTLLDYADYGGIGLDALFYFTPSSSGTFFLRAEESGNNAIGSYTIWIVALPTVSIADASVTEGNTGTTNLVFTLTLSAASSIPVSVTAATRGTSTATAGVDYNVAF